VSIAGAVRGRLVRCTALLPWSTDASAGIPPDGLSETRVVGGTIATSVMSDDDVSPQFVERVIAVAVQKRWFDTTFFGRALGLSRDELLDTDSALTELGGSPRADESIAMNEAKRIARDGSDRQGPSYRSRASYGA